jgi:hypothetical protein
MNYPWPSGPATLKHEEEWSRGNVVRRGQTTKYDRLSYNGECRKPSGCFQINTIAALSVAVLVSSTLAYAQSRAIRLDDSSIQYLKRPLQDPVAELSRKVQAGQVQLHFDENQGYLRSVLDALGVPVESQMAVFSKTSVQELRIGPKTPRVLYFNDSVVVGWVKRGSLELASLDPRQGMIFYTVDQRLDVHERRLNEPATARTSLFQRRTDCLSCHISATQGVPGALLRSMFVGRGGAPLRRLGATDTDDRTRFDQLWGGWYVTGDSGSGQHRGNRVVTEANAKPVKLDLLPAFDGSSYPSASSDIVALMVFRHQMHMTNLLIEMGWKARAGRYTAEGLGDAARTLVDYLLFIDESPLPNGIHGTSGFAERFAAQGPCDGKGRSLRQLDLHRRLMRYPCSYMIYSEAFDQLPAEAKKAIYRRIGQILSGEEKSPRYAKLSAADRKAIIDILQDTKKDLADWDWIHLR